ncbi:MAG: helix-turn-helix domain-containing protein [Bacteroides sp.]|nr:helix-turn-helix domain-containing protein [Eubacterium sp.]MCM1417463.1 helix-turn-helix domain-containing protein [Roseburia sp.]MCM1461643.1 helix-turn-helix domain-containing protein [Bacteroides sp.]
MTRRFNENLRKFRREKGFTQEQLAERVGVSS